MAVISDFGFKRMTPVQAATLPVFLSHKDVVVQAQTGSGKTLAFVIPCFEIMLRRKPDHRKYEVGVIIVSPTQELAQQTFEVFSRFIAKAPRLTIQLVTGASNPKAFERDYLSKGANIIVATPGRLSSMIEHVKKLDVRQLEVLVLDEADRLLDMGFDRQIRRILCRLPKQRRTGLFSATQTTQIDELIKAGLRNPVTVNVQVTKKRKKSAKNSAGGDTKELPRPNSIPDTLQNWFVVVKPHNKLVFLADFLIKHKNQKMIVFFLTCASVDYFASIIPKLSQAKKSNLRIFHLHGKMNSSKRKKQFKSFKSTQKGALFCTDVAARGIDLPDLHWILQFDPPLDPSFFVHRIGRTSRAGREGSAVVILMPNEEGYAEYLQSRNVPISRLEKGYYSIETKPAQESEKIPENSTRKFPEVVQEAHQLAAGDRAIMEAGQHAFVSFIRAYKEHELAFTMMFHKVPFAEVAHGYGLLFFPRLPDIKHFKIKFDNPLKINAVDIKFKDKHREKKRLENMARRKEKNEKEKAEREARDKERRKNKRKQKPKRRRKRVHQEIKDEWEELQREANLMKKLKKGKVSKKEFLKAVGEVSDDDDLGE